MLNLSKDKKKSLGSFYTPDSLADKEVANIEQIVEHYVSRYIDNNINRNNNNKIIINNNNITIVKTFADDKTLNIAEQALADDEEEFEEAVNELKLLS